MKYILSISLLLAFAASLPAQTLPITYERSFLGPTFRYDNLVVQSVNFRNALYQDGEALAVLTGTGAMEFGAITLGAFGTLFLIEGIFAEDDVDRVFDDSGTALAVGGALFVGGALLQGVTNRKRIRAVDIYNANLGFDQPMGNHMEYELGPTKDGVGLTLTF